MGGATLCLPPKSSSAKLRHRNPLKSSLIEGKGTSVLKALRYDEINGDSNICRI